MRERLYIVSWVIPHYIQWLSTHAEPSCLKILLEQVNGRLVFKLSVHLGSQSTWEQAPGWVNGFSANKLAKCGLGPEQEELNLRIPYLALNGLTDFFPGALPGSLFAGYI